MRESSGSSSKSLPESFRIHTAVYKSGTRCNGVIESVGGVAAESARMGAWKGGVWLGVGDHDEAECRRGRARPLQITSNFV